MAKVAQSCQHVAKIAKKLQKKRMQKVVKHCKKFAKSCEKFLMDAKRWQNLPKDGKSCQYLFLKGAKKNDKISPRKCQSCEKFQKVAKTLDIW